MKKVVVTMAVAGLLAAFLSAQGVVSIVADRDNTLYQSTSGSLSNGIGTAFFCGRTNQGLRRRGLIHFDVAGNVPAGATLLAATVRLEMNQTAAGPLPIGLHRVSADWGEGASFPATGNGGSGAPATTNDATWLHRFYPTLFWATPGGDFSATASASISVGLGGFYDWTSAQILADVQSFLDTPATNFGWLLKSPETLIGDAKRFTSREEVVPQGWPRLIVTYATPPSASVSNLGLGCNGVTLAAVGLPTVGNGSFAFSISGGSSFGTAYVIPAIGVASPPVPLGGGCYFDLDVTTALAFLNAGYALGPIFLDIAGNAPSPAPIPPLGGLHGLIVDFQAITVGPSIWSSNALRLVLGS